jgi:hypothetical protein
MKKRLFVILIPLSLFVSSIICSAEDFYTVKVYKMMGGYEYKAMSRSEFNDLAKEIKNENMQFSRAQRLAETEWNKQKDAGRYPGRALHQRKLMKVKSYKTRQAAEDYILKKTESAEKAQERKEERYEKSMRRKTRGRDGMQKRRAIEKRQQQKEENAAKREAKLEKGYECFIKHLNSLTHPGGADSSVDEEEEKPAE